MVREFIYFSAKAPTTGNYNENNLKSAGRLDIVCNVIIHCFFISNTLRNDVKLHLVFYGPPEPPKHIILEINKETPISKKNISGLLKRILFKGKGLKEGKKVEAFPGCCIEKKSLLKVIEDLKKEGKKICILDKNGKNLRDEKISNSVFVLGDHEGLPKKEFNRLRKNESLVSIGKKTYFSSQTIVILHNEIDLREENLDKKT